MAFRNDLEAQLRRSEALERDLREEREQTADLRAEVEELEARLRGSTSQQNEEQTAELRAKVEELEARLSGSTSQQNEEPPTSPTGEARLPPSRLRRVFAVSSFALGLAAAVLSVVAHASEQTGVPAYDLAEQLVYTPMSVALALLGLAYLMRPALARLGFLAWGTLGISIEIADFFAESVLFGTTGPWLDTIVWFVFPVVVVAVFLKREPETPGSQPPH